MTPSTKTNKAKSCKIQKFTYLTLKEVCRYLPMETRHSLVRHTKCSDLRQINAKLPFTFKNLVLEKNGLKMNNYSVKVTCDNENRPQFEIRTENDPPKTVNLENSKISQKEAVDTVMKFFLNREGTIAEKLSLFEPEHLANFDFPLTVIDELSGLRNSFTFQANHFDKIKIAKQLTLIRLTDFQGDDSIYNLPMLTSAKTLKIITSDRSKVARIKKLRCQKIVCNDTVITSSELRDVYEQWTKDDREIGASIEFKVLSRMNPMNDVEKWEETRKPPSNGDSGQTPSYHHIAWQEDKMFKISYNRTDNTLRMEVTPNSPIVDDPDFDEPDP